MMQSDECSVCQRYIGDLDPDKRIRHTSFCNALQAVGKLNASEIASSSSIIKANVREPSDVNATRAQTEPKKSTATRKISRNKLEQEFFKFTVEEQRKILDSLLSSVKVESNVNKEEDVAIVKNKVSSRSAENSVSSKLENDLFNLRMELGEIINSEAELRLKEKRVRTNIKKLTRKVSILEEQNLTFGLPVNEDLVIQALFPAAKYESLSTKSSKDINECPLWRLSRLCDLFDENSSSRALNEERDAVIPLDQEPAVKNHPTSNRDIDWSNVGSTCVVQSQDRTILAGVDVEAGSTESTSVIDLTLRSQPSPTLVGVDSSAADYGSPIVVSRPQAVSLFSQVVASTSAVVNTPHHSPPVQIGDVFGKTQQSAVESSSSESPMWLELLQSSFDLSREDINQDYTIEAPSIDAILSKLGLNLSSGHLQHLRQWFANVLRTIEIELSSREDSHRVYFRYMNIIHSLNLRILHTQDSMSRVVLTLLTELAHYLTRCWYSRLSVAGPCVPETEECVSMDDDADVNNALLSQGGFMMSQSACLNSVAGLKRPLEVLVSTPPLSNEIIPAEPEDVALLIEQTSRSSPISKKSCVRDSASAPDDFATDATMVPTEEMIELTPPCTQSSHGYGLDNPIELITPSPAVTAASAAADAALAVEALDEVAVNLLSACDPSSTAVEPEKPAEEIFNWGNDYFIYDQDFTTYDTSDSTFKVAEPAEVVEVDAVPGTESSNELGCAEGGSVVINESTTGEVGSVVAIVPTTQTPSSARKTPRAIHLPPTNNENVAQNHQEQQPVQQLVQQAVTVLAPARGPAVAAASVTEAMTLDEALTSFIRNSRFYDDILSFKPIDLDRLRYEFTSGTNRKVSDVHLLKYLDKEGVFVSRFGGTGAVGNQFGEGF